MKKHLLILLIFIPVTVFSQEQNINLWTRVNVAKKITKKISLELDGQWRLNNNLTTTGAYVAELGAGYKLNKHWEVSAFYRFISRRKYDKSEGEYVYKPYHRFYANVSYNRKIGFLKFDYRLRYQNQFKDDNGLLENDKSYLRNKLEIAYPNKSRFTPAVSADLFYRIGEAFDELRYRAEVDYKINKRNIITIGGFVSHEFNNTKLDDFTLLVSYKLKL